MNHQLSQETLTGIVELVIHHDEKNDWGVLRVRVPEESEPVRLVGTITGIDVDKSIQAEGSWGQHSEHGRQFKASKITVVMPTSQDGKEMLAGIVELVIHHDEKNDWGVLRVRAPEESEPVRLVGTITGIDVDKSIQAEGSWGQHPEHGRQFKASKITVVMPTSQDGKEMLAGIVELVIHHDEKNDWGVLRVRVPEESEPVRLVGTITGIDVDKSIQAEGSWGQHSEHGRQFKASKITVVMPTSQDGKEMLAGIVELVIHHDEKNDWGVLRVRVPGESEPVRLVGTITGIDVDKSIQAEGSWGQHPEHGRQFKASRITLVM